MLINIGKQMSQIAAIATHLISSEIVFGFIWVKRKIHCELKRIGMEN